MTCVSSGTISFAGLTDDQPPGSTRSCRTIHLRNRFNRLQPLPDEGRGKKYPTRRGVRRDPYTGSRSTPHAHAPNESSAGPISACDCSILAAKQASIEP
jgi:hypothetical protein